MSIMIDIPFTRLLLITMLTALCLSNNVSHSLSVLSPVKKNSRQVSSSNNGNVSLGKQSTALDVLTYLNKNSLLANYVTHNNDKKRQPVVVVTGGSSGIGLPTVETLSLAGMKVVLCARNVTSAQMVIENEIPKSLQANIRIQEMDLSDMASIEAAVMDIVKEECSGSDIDGDIDVLLNNAGVMAPPKRLSTVQGLELQFGTNHVGHHMLTRLLLPYMRNDGRIVTVASTAHAFGSLDFANLNYDVDAKSQRLYTSWGAYGQSKLANVLFAKSLDDKLKETGSNIKSVSLHPGVIGTNLWRYSPSWTKPFLSSIVADKNAQQGAATNVFCCLVESSKFNGGEYLMDCEIAQPNSQGKDESGNLRKQLWDATELLITNNGYTLPKDVY